MRWRITGKTAEAISKNFFLLLCIFESAPGSFFSAHLFAVGTLYRYLSLPVTDLAGSIYFSASITAGTDVLGFSGTAAGLAGIAGIA